jgi:hypothetical protein
MEVILEKRPVISTSLYTTLNKILKTFSRHRKIYINNNIINNTGTVKQSGNQNS